VRSENSFEHYTRMTQKRRKAFVYQVYSLYLYIISSRKSALKEARKTAIFKEVQYINLCVAVWNFARYDTHKTHIWHTKRQKI